MRHADAGKTTRETCLVRGLANDSGAGPEEDLPFSLDARRETLEATIRLRRYEPYGVCGGEELVEGRRVPECQRDDLNACGSRLGKANVRGGDDLMPAERGQILEKRRAHCQTFARERCRDSTADEAAAAHELVHENSHHSLRRGKELV